MKIKWLNNILPNLFQPRGHIAYLTRDNIGRILVIDNGDNRILSFDSMFEQSRMRMDNPYHVAHKYIQIMLLVLAYTKPRHITMLGLGGGSILRTLHHVLPDCLFTIVELRSTVVSVAKEFFEIPHDDRVKITINDGMNEVLNMENNSTDIIFSDMYHAYDMDQDQLQYKFLCNCSRVLTDCGWLVLNLHSLPGENTDFFRTLKENFSTVMMSSTSGNFIFFASKQKPQLINLSNQTIEALETASKQSFLPLLQTLKLTER